jgi:hypothetical protein
MTPTEVIDKYYEYANTGNWNLWLELFAENTILDEQLAGHVEGLSNLRKLMSGFGGYSSFKNRPEHVIINDCQGAVVSHISAVTTSGVSIEAGVMNYFRFDAQNKIVYFANFHDTVPFQPFLDQSN